jgi:hypothetical protein
MLSRSREIASVEVRLECYCDRRARELSMKIPISDDDDEAEYEANNTEREVAKHQEVKKHQERAQKEVEILSDDFYRDK